MLLPVFFNRREIKTCFSLDKIVVISLGPGLVDEFRFVFQQFEKKISKILFYISVSLNLLIKDLPFVPQEHSTPHVSVK